MKNQGFILLLVLMVVVVAGVALAGISRRSCLLSVQALSQQQQLQLRWGAASLKAVYLPIAEAVLQDAAGRAGRPMVSAAIQVQLGDMPFDLLLTDEQAKLNVNALVENRRGYEVLPAALLKLQADLRRSAPANPCPISADCLQDPRMTSLFSYDQLFGLARPQELLSRPGETPTILDRVTCWGSGQVNVRRAEECVLREALAGLLSDSDIHRIIQLRAAQPPPSLDQMLEGLKLPAQKHAGVAQGCTDVSGCHGLWIIGRTSSRVHTRLHVAEGGDGAEVANCWSFAW